MRIHVITNLFAPDELGGAALYTDMAIFLKERGHDVRVTTTFSYYPAWALKPEDQGVAQRDEVHMGVPVRRVKMYVPKKVTGASRMLSDLSFLFSLIRRAPYRDWKPQIVFTGLPMLSECLAMRFMYIGQGIPCYIVVKDFVVDSALELGILKLPLLGGLLRGVERWALRSAQTLSTIGPQMLDKLVSIVGTDRHMVMIPDWIHRSLQNEIDRQAVQKPARDPFTLVYSGNLGIKQGLPAFIEQFCEASKSGLKWKVEIYGGGANKGSLAAIIGDNPSVNLFGVQDEVAYVANLLRATMCLVTQLPGVGANFLPSKLLPALATGTPVLAVCEPDSPLGKEIAISGCGEIVKPADPAALYATLKKWQDNPELLIEMSRRAKERAKIYERNFVLSKYEVELERMLQPSAADSLAPASSQS